MFHMEEMHVAIEKINSAVHHSSQNDNMELKRSLQCDTLLGQKRITEYFPHTPMAQPQNVNSDSMETASSCNIDGNTGRITVTYKQ